MAVIRQETPKDYEAVFALVRDAFLEASHSDGQEHNLVNRLRKKSDFIPELSLVAEEDGTLLGHILLTRTDIVDGEQIYQSLTLAPVSVLPGHQGEGIGDALIRAGMEAACGLGFGSIVLLGHADYYPRFGFRPASHWNILPPFEVPDENFMACELKPGALGGVRGTVAFSKEFFEEG